MTEHPQREPDAGEEFAHADDAIIGRALKWSLGAAVGRALVGAGAYFALRFLAAKSVEKVSALASPEVVAAPTVKVPTVQSTDIT